MAKRKKRRKGRGKAKGSSFEREVCVTLSEWWSKGKRDDIFWRSASSGGRATRRKQKGKHTAGSSGDIATIDKDGDPLIDLLSIEVKRGYSKCSLADLLDKPDDERKHPLPIEAMVTQAQLSCETAGSASWMIVMRRDTKKAIVIMPRDMFMLFGIKSPVPSMSCNFKTKDGVSYRLVAMRFDKFLSSVNPSDVRRLGKEV